MKKIGTTQDNQILVKMTDYEFEALATLALAIEGERFIGMHPGATNHNFGAINIGTALGAVKEFAENRILMNRVIERLTEITEAWGRTDKENKEALKQAEDHQVT